ncbi:MAG: choice-of-anchor D domain-containing protein [Luteolibacter sp.]|uniref:choice-of-anchor D domain-containing protein n=1 Tax=Luteolibacter sp. TaxID=1962973 RepID=UPI00326342C0
MKFLFLAAATVIAAIVPAMALTRADIKPGKLAGKTLVFTIGDSSPPFATLGIWKGKFQTKPVNSFTIVRVSGSTPNISTTRTYIPDGNYETYSLATVSPGSGIAILSIFPLPDGSGGYQMRLTDDDTAFQTGTFTISTEPADGPEINVQQPKGTELTDGESKKSFGTVKVGQTSTVKTFTIKNAGNAPLTGISLAKGGGNSGEFTVTGLGSKSVAPGKSTTFKVSFKPASTGTRNASVRIASNDSDEKPFDIKLTGEGASK